MRTIPWLGLVAAKEITITNIGPIHGVHPIENDTPIKKEPINPVGRFLNVNRLSFIKKSKFKKQTMTRPKKIIKIAPICLIKPWYVIKNSDTMFVLKPIIIKITEKPSKNNIVCVKLFFVNILLSSLNSLTLIPVI